MGTQQITKENVIGGYRTLIASQKGGVDKDIYISTTVFDNGDIHTSFKVFNNKKEVKVSPNNMEKAIEIYNSI